MAATPSIAPRKKYPRLKTSQSRIRSYLPTGGRSIMYLSGASLPRARPGSMSEPKSMDKIWMIERGRGILRKN